MNIEKFLFAFFWYFMNWGYQPSLSPKNAFIKRLKFTRFYWLFIVEKLLVNCN